MPISRVNGVDIYWERVGEVGEPLVLVHGSWGDHRNWAAVVPGLASIFRVLTYDRRGHSRSERPGGQGRIRDDVADLAALLQELRHAPAHVVGNSFGASIVLRLASERPELFRSMIVHEPPLFGLLEGDPGAREALDGVRRRLGAVTSLLEEGNWSGGARRFVEEVAFGPGAWAELPAEVKQTFIFNGPTWLDEMRDPEALAFNPGGLRAFEAPALLTSGDRSPPFFSRVVDRISAELPRATRRTHAGVGHVPHLSHPAMYVREVTTFVGGGYHQ